MAERRSVDQSSSHPSLTSNPVQVPTQNGDIQEMDKDNAQKKVQLHFYNCTVHLGSSDVNNITIRDSGNQLVAILHRLFVRLLFLLSVRPHVTRQCHIIQTIIGRNRSSEVLHLQPPAVSNNGKSTIFPNCILTILVTTTSTDSPLHNDN